MAAGRIRIEEAGLEAVGVWGWMSSDNSFHCGSTATCAFVLTYYEIILNVPWPQLRPSHKAQQL